MGMADIKEAKWVLIPLFVNIFETTPIEVLHISQSWEKQQKERRKPLLNTSSMGQVPGHPILTVVFKSIIIVASKTS